MVILVILGGGGEKENRSGWFNGMLVGRERGKGNETLLVFF